MLELRSSRLHDILHSRMLSFSIECKFNGNRYKIQILTSQHVGLLSPATSMLPSTNCCIMPATNFAQPHNYKVYVHGTVHCVSHYGKYVADWVDRFAPMYMSPLCTLFDCFLVAPQQFCAIASIQIPLPMPMSKVEISD